jgi:hypothetical protein
MRTSVTLEDDVYGLASLYARAKGITLGKAIGELVRKGESAPGAPSEIHYSANGLPMFPPRAGVITAELVKRLENESE